MDTVLATVSIIFDNLCSNVSWQRWSRIRRIRLGLRSIRRCYPAMRFTETRQDQIIKVEFQTEPMLTQFALVWRSELPAWRREY